MAPWRGLRDAEEKAERPMLLPQQAKEYDTRGSSKGGKKKLPNTFPSKAMPKKK